MNIFDLFKNNDNEFGKFELVENKQSDRPDLHAFIVLDTIFPGNENMVQYTENGNIFLGIEGDQLGSLFEATIVELIRCGVQYDEEYDSLFMMVD